MMTLNAKLDRVIGILQALADAPEAADVRRLQGLLREKLSLLPMPERPAGTKVDLGRTGSNLGQSPRHSADDGNSAGEPAAGRLKARFSDTPGLRVTGPIRKQFQMPDISVPLSLITGFKRSGDGRLLCIQVFHSELTVPAGTLHWAP
ncbi:MAG TPA: hypothetical protein ENH78_01405 [Phycisphaerae bacterium]|nr:hypothetical protein [Phycisphaerae bacterium]